MTVGETLEIVTTVDVLEFVCTVALIRILISTEYVSPGLTPYSVTLVLLVVIGDWSELTLCVIRKL